MMVNTIRKGATSFPAMRKSPVRAAREHYFTTAYPADTIVEVSALGLPEFEIEAIALTDGEIIG